LHLFTSEECKYHATLLRDPGSNKELTSDQLELWSEKAKTTIEVLVSNMVNPIVLNKIFFKNYKVTNVENTIKLFYRATILYEAREVVSVILKCIVEIEVAMLESGVMWRIL
jgi:hypothetical protein